MFAHTCDHHACEELLQNLAISIIMHVIVTFCVLNSGFDVHYEHCLYQLKMQILNILFRCSDLYQVEDVLRLIGSDEEAILLEVMMTDWIVMIQTLKLVILIICLQMENMTFSLNMQMIIVMIMTMTMIIIMKISTLITMRMKCLVQMTVTMNHLFNEEIPKKEEKKTKNQKRKP